MSAEENKAIVRRLWRVFNEGNLNKVDELVADDHVLHEPELPEEERGPEAIKAMFFLFRKVSPDIHLVVDDEMIAEEDKVVSRWTASGTQAEELKSVEGAGDGVAAVSGISIFRVSDGKIKETWQRLEAHWDQSEMTFQEEVQEEVYRYYQDLGTTFGIPQPEKWSPFFCMIIPRWCRRRRRRRR